MAERGILFSAPMVRALLAGTKTQTRRIVKMHRGDHTFVLEELPGGAWWPFRSDDGESSTMSDGNEYPYACPYGVPGDTLWVRETWAGSVEGGIDYCADGHEYGRDDEGKSLIRWRPSIHMPRRFSRLTLTLTDVRVERLQEITADGARAEGVVLPVAPCTDRCQHEGRTPATGHPLVDVRSPMLPSKDGPPWTTDDFWRAAYARLWEEINGPGSWDANPFVWVLTFERADAAAQKETAHG